MVTDDDVTVRRCREADLDRFGVFGSARHVEHCRREFRQAGVVILVAVDDADAPVGKLHVDLTAKAAEGVALIGSAAVSPSLRRRGIGTALMRSAEAFIRGHRLGTAELGVEDANPDARRLYERLGYRAVGVDVFTYEVDGADGRPVRVAHPGTVMRKTLEPSEQDVWDTLAAIPDPEIPVISLVDLGVVRDVAVESGRVRVAFTPTFLGCPALETMRAAMEERIRDLGAEPQVDVVLDDSWSTDRITPAGREKLRESGFAPPAPRSAGALQLVQLQSKAFRCPYCGSSDTRLENIFGPTPCRSLRYCSSCRQPFEQFKTI